MTPIRTASIATLGCKLNQSESDSMARQLAAAGVALVSAGVPADLYLINSCTVTHVGDRKSRQLIRQAARTNPEAFVVVAGCYAELEPDEVGAIVGVDAVIGNSGKDRLIEVLRAHGLRFPGSDQRPATSNQRTAPPLRHSREGGNPGNGHGGECRLPTSGAPPSRRSPGDRGRQDAGAPPEERMPDRVRHDIPLVAGRLNKAARAFVKVQDGCDNACSYCVVPRARGPHRSVPAEHAIAEIRSLVEAGYQEVVLTGVNISAYGRDGTSESGAAARGQGLARLLRRILDETDLPRLRLSSLQPEDWHPDLFALWDSGRLCRHLHLSLQSGSNSVLRRMRRCYDVERYAAIVEEARRQVPGVAITTDVIVGFPGETDQEFAETERFIRAVGFAGLHVFKYSPREGTVAATMEGQVHSRVKQERSARLPPRWRARCIPG